MKAMSRLVCLLLGLQLAFTSVATEEKYPFENAQQRSLFMELSKELRCPKCQNQNLADSDAMIAADLKRKVHELVLAGNDKDQVISYMKQRYGDFVYYQPPVNSMTIWLWLLPALFIVLALAALVMSRKKVSVSLDAQQQQKINELLERDK
ncbi:cytochrome c-type biogenesis protein [Paraglaciecola hydrolytica]|uniref:Cytochrome c-type biogenesis protein n=1 Tax=Paraglaciecola hydrolytica TaxID=1799789 RepID=A0A135ZYV2_9ALTE|nr:cytochrome C biogenesis protein CcmH [Paraglaciecola hydrolytica]